jgi:hypothetical protein
MGMHFLLERTKLGEGSGYGLMTGQPLDPYVDLISLSTPAEDDPFSRFVVQYLGICFVVSNFYYNRYPCEAKVPHPFSAFAPKYQKIHIKYYYSIHNTVVLF